MMNASPTSTWPHQRRCPDEFQWMAPALQTAWDFSSSQINCINQRLAESPLPSNVSTVVVSGSLARMEAHEGSDLDLLVVVNDSDEQSGQASIDMVWDRLNSVKLRKPKGSGIFSQPVERTKLFNEDAKGVVDESLVVFGQRMQLLIDAQPIYGVEEFDGLRQDILRWYSEHRVATQFQEPGCFHWLWQDVQRYWRSIRSRACWLHADDPAKSLEVNVKLRSTRLAIVFSFLLTLAEAHDLAGDPDHAVRQVVEQMRKTPLERLVLGFDDDKTEKDAFVAAYDTTLRFLAGLSSGSAPEDLPKEVAEALQKVSRHLVQLIRSEGGEISEFSPDWIC